MEECTHLVEKTESVTFHLPCMLQNVSNMCAISLKVAGLMVLGYLTCVRLATEYKINGSHAMTFSLIILSFIVHTRLVVVQLCCK